MELSNIVLVLLLAGSSYARPQTVDAETTQRQETWTRTSNADWKALRTTEEATENVRGDSSRYTENSGSRRESYINYYRDTNASPSIESRGSVVEVSSVRGGSFDRNPTEKFSSRIADSVEFGRRDRSVYASRRLNLAKLDPGAKRLGDIENAKARVSGLDDARYSKADDPRAVALNNSGKRSSTLNQNPNAEEDEEAGAMSDRDYRKNAVASTYRNSVKVERSDTTPLAPTNRFDRLDAARHVANISSKRPENENVDTRPTFAMRIESGEGPFGMNFDGRRKTIEKSRSSTYRPIADRGDGSKMNRTSTSRQDVRIAPNAFLKNWPNDIPKDAEDFYNYEKYTALPDHQIQNFSQNSSAHHRVPAMHGGVQEIVQWLQVPAFASNQSQMLEIGGGPISVTFKPLYEDLEPNSPSKPSDDNVSGPSYANTFLDDRIHHDAQHASSEFQTSSNYVTNPTLDLLPSLSLAERKPTYKPVTQITQNTVVRIVNANPKKSNSTKNEVKGPQSIAKPSKENADLPGMSLNDDCPTILISSITKVNNTIQSKEGCTDLNIIVNSEILNSNVIKAVDTAVDDPDSLGPDPSGSDKYLGSNNYGSPATVVSNSPSYQAGYIPQKDETLGPQVSSDVPTVQVVQNTQVSVTNSNEQLDDVDGSMLTERPGQQDSSGSSGDAVAPTGGQEQPASTFVDSPGVQQGNSDASGLQVAGVQNRPGVSNVASQLAGTRPSSGIAAGSPSSGIADNDDDDEEDGFDLSPGGILEAITSTFTYLTFFNPMHYFVSLAAAPFAALAAGVLGISAFLFPWAFPSAFDFGRANEPIRIRFRPNLEEVVRQSFRKYERLNEWKSKKRKRRYLSSEF